MAEYDVIPEPLDGVEVLRGPFGVARSCGSHCAAARTEPHAYQTLRHGQAVFMLSSPRK